MRAARLHAIGGLPQVDEIDPPSGPGLVRVSASALNPVDISIGNGRFYGGTPDPPYTIGSEVIGENDGGRRVWVYGRTLMSDLCDPAGSTWALDVPDGVDDSLALACGIAGLTAWTAVAWRAPVRPDDTVLVLGASGTLGSVAVRGAKLLGAKRVIGAARRTDLVPEEADDVFDLSEEGPLPEATLIVDGLWGEPIERALATAARGVRVVHLGQSAGPSATLLSSWVRGKVADIHGHSLHNVPVDDAQAAYRELCELARDGRMPFAIERYPLTEVAAAWERQASGSPGAKIVLQF